MEKFNGFRDNLAKTLKSIEDHDDRRDFLGSVEETKAYKDALEYHLSEKNIKSHESVVINKDEISKGIEAKIREYLQDDNFYDAAILATDSIIGENPVLEQKELEQIVEAGLKTNPTKRSRVHDIILYNKAKMAGVMVKENINTNIEAAQKQVEKIMQQKRFFEAAYLLAHLKSLGIVVNFDTESLTRGIEEILADYAKKDFWLLYVHILSDIKIINLKINIDINLVKEKIEMMLNDFSARKDYENYAKVRACAAVLNLE